MNTQHFGMLGAPVMHPDIDVLRDSKEKGRRRGGENGEGDLFGVRSCEHNGCHYPSDEGRIEY